MAIGACIILRGQKNEIHFYPHFFAGKQQLPKSFYTLQHR